MNAKLSGFLLSFLCILTCLNICDAQDPGIPDTVRFGEWKACVPCPPCSGMAVVPVEFFNDEGIGSFWISLKKSQNVNTDTVLFIPEYDNFFSIWNLGIGDSANPTYNKDKIFMAAVSFADSVRPSSESRAIFYLYFLVSDTGIVSLDTTQLYCPGECPILDFTTPGANTFTPQFQKTQFHITPTPKGDANLDGVVNLGDPIFLARYIFGREIVVYDLCNPCTDMNEDGKIDLSDVIALAKYILGG